MQIYQRVFLITSTLESSTAPFLVSCFLVRSCDLFPLRMLKVSKVFSGNFPSIPVVKIDPVSGDTSSA